MEENTENVAVESTPVQPVVKPSPVKSSLFAAPGMKIIAFAFGAFVLTFAIGGLYIVGNMMRGDAEETGDGEDVSEEQGTEENGDSQEEDVVVEEDEGTSMVYLLDDEVILIDADGVSTVVDTLVNPYSSDDGALPCYPQFSPDGTKILYSSNLDLMVYDISLGTSQVVYTGQPEGMSADLLQTYSLVTRYTWKDNDEIVFVSDVADEDAMAMESTKHVKLLDLGTLAVSEWGTYTMKTGFGGMTSDPARMLMWHHHDMLGLEYRMYFDDDKVYVHSYPVDQPAWMEIVSGGTGTVVADNVVDTIAGIEDFEMTMSQTGDYESAAIHEVYVLDKFGMSPVNFTYFDSTLANAGVDILTVSAQGLWNLMVDDDGEYLYYVEIENSTDLAAAIDAEVADPSGSYPLAYIKKIDLTSNVVELVTEGEGFDIY